MFRLATGNFRRPMCLSSSHRAEVGKHHCLDPLTKPKWPFNTLRTLRPTDNIHRQKVLCAVSADAYMSYFFLHQSWVTTIRRDPEKGLDTSKM